MTLRLLGWILIVVGLMVFALDGYFGDGPNLLWALPAMLGAAIVARTPKSTADAKDGNEGDVSDT